jgi:hypothetical protein
MKEGGSFTVATDHPTKAEFDTATAAGQVTIVEGISNGHRTKKWPLMLPSGQHMPDAGGWPS